MEGEDTLYVCKSIQWNKRTYGGINGYTPYEMFLMKGTRLNSCKNNKTVKQIKSVTHVGKWICYLSMEVQQLIKHINSTRQKNLF